MQRKERASFSPSYNSPASTMADKPPAPLSDQRGAFSFTDVTSGLVSRPFNVTVNSQQFPPKSGGISQERSTIINVQFV
jgi:hypothetical protein